MTLDFLYRYYDNVYDLYPNKKHPENEFSQKQSQGKGSAILRAASGIKPDTIILVTTQEFKF